MVYSRYWILTDKPGPLCHGSIRHRHHLSRSGTRPLRRARSPSILGSVSPARSPWRIRANPLCPVCASAVRVEREIPACPACAGTVAPYEVANDTCQACRERPTRLAGSVRVGVYRGALAGLLRAYKFRDAEHLGELLIAWLTDAVRQAPWVERTEAIVPVPTHWSRRLRRRYYPRGSACGGCRTPHGACLDPATAQGSGRAPPDRPELQRPGGERPRSVHPAPAGSSCATHVSCWSTMSRRPVQRSRNAPRCSCMPGRWRSTQPRSFERTSPHRARSESVASRT